MPQTAVSLVLADEERAELARWSQGRLPWLAERARIVLACAEPGSGVARVAAQLGSTRMTVRKWRRRFAEEGLAGLADHDRPGRPVADLVLTGAERDQLTRWARRASKRSGPGAAGQGRAGVRGRGDEQAGRGGSAS